MAKPAKKPNPNGNETRDRIKALQNDPARWRVGPFMISNRAMRDMGFVLIDTEDGGKEWKKRKAKKRGIGFTRAPSSKRLPAKKMVDRHMAKNVIKLDDHRPEEPKPEAPKSRGPEPKAAKQGLWDRAKNLFRRSRGRG